MVEHMMLGYRLVYYARLQYQHVLELCYDRWHWCVYHWQYFHASINIHEQLVLLQLAEEDGLLLANWIVGQMLLTGLLQHAVC
jgi:hypothetical protein